MIYLVYQTDILSIKLDLLKYQNLGHVWYVNVCISNDY